MGDFCVSGFHSNLPIHRGNKVVAIICKEDHKNVPGNHPCYLDGKLSPIALPIIGEMGDYGYLDNWEESETTKLIEKYTEMSMSDVFDEIVHCSKWDKESKYPEVFKIFDKCGIYKGEYPPQYRYTIIYEHYSVYKAMTYKMDDTRKWLESSAKFQYLFNKAFPDVKKSEISNAYPNIFSDICGITEPYRDIRFTPGKIPEFNMQTPEQQEFHMFYAQYRDIEKPHLNCNINLTDYMSLYFMGDYDIHNMIDEIIDWVSFVNTLDYIGGHFYYSVSAGQEWHHDKEYREDRRHIFEAMIGILDMFDKEDEELDDDYDDEEENEIEETDDND